MPSSSESKEKSDGSGSQETKETKKLRELPPYRYDALKNPDALRLVRLIPAEDSQRDIDCRIIQIDLPTDDEPRREVSDGKEEQQAENSNGVIQAPQELDLPVLMSLLKDYQRNDKMHAGAHVQTQESADEETTPDKGDKAKQSAKEGEEYLPKTSYEAVSWCWGREPADEILRVHDGDKVFAFPISKNLRMALWALRTNDEVRQLWIDAICINQGDVEERNQQVPRMDRIYGGAQSVCIWLGDATEDSKLAMDFIRDRVLELWTFDKLIEDINLARHWAALITLMKRPWFSRRWVVQEIALSPRGGTIYCGKDHNSWQDFADAVSLFVEVESATHRLSDVMKLDQSFGNIPNFFGDVSSLGAALLVEATSNLFRNSMTGQRIPLSSLEYLVSRLSVFEATQPRDTIYALLAISKETTPKNFDPKELKPEEKRALQLAPKEGFGNTNYNVDYRLPVIDVYKEFIEFSISKSDKKRALDILCRAWAPTVLKSHDDPNFLKPTREKDLKREKQRWTNSGNSELHRKKELEVPEEGEEGKKDRETPLPSWIPGLSGAAFEMEEHPTAGLRMERQNADPLVGFPDGSGRRNYAAAGDTVLNKLKFRKWDTLRKPGSNYPEYSMFVEGFVLDEVATVEHLAANGNIPFRWLQAGGWLDTDEYPPDDFWRTLVADRAQNGQNPPTYFPRACKESMRYKAKTMSKAGGYVDCRKLIEEGRCTIVAQFLRRVQEVIWNRQLMRTKGGRLGLVRDDVSPGYKICILYGCSVPVVLEEAKKTDSEITAEVIDRYNQWYDKVKMAVAVCEFRYWSKKTRREEEKRAEEQRTRLIPRPQLHKFHTLPVTRGESAAKTSSAPLEKPSRPLSTLGEISPTLDVDADRPSDITASSKPEPVMEPVISVNTPNRSPPPQESMLAENGEHVKTKLLSQNQEVDVTLKLETSIKQGSLSTHVRSMQAETHISMSEEERAARKQESLEFFEIWQQEENERIVQEVLNNKFYYRLVGESYIHGMMNGEAIALQNEAQLFRKNFELR